MRKILCALLAVLSMLPTGARAEMVSNVISNSTVYQYIFINCANNDCRALFEEAVSTANQAPPDQTVEPIDNGFVADNGSTNSINPTNLANPINPGPIVENNMPIAEQTIITVVDPPAVESGAVNLPEPTELPVNPTEAAATETVVSEQNPVTTSAESVETTAEATSTATAVESFFTPAERKVVISEIMSAPLAGNVEWVEIENRGGGNVDLTGWTLVEGSGKKTALFGTIQPGNYLMFEKSSLNNSGDVVILKDETGAAVNEVSYGDWNDGNLADNAPATKTGNSTALFGETYKETEVPTPNQENIFQLTAIEPVAVLTTSAAAVSVTESSVATSALVQTATPPATAQTPVSVPPTEPTAASPTFQFSDKIKISEFLADPAGADDGLPAQAGEWIELYNEGDVDVDLFGWSVDDAEGGSKPYKIERHVTIKADDFQVFKKEETLLVLNNSSDEVRLFDPENKLVDKAVYSSVKENHSWAWLNGGWQDSAASTPGLPNQTAGAVEKETALQVAIAAPSRERSGQFQTDVSAKTTKVTKTGAAVKSVSPAEAVALPVRTKVSVTGQVVAGQNVFGKNYFYLDGAQVYWSGLPTQVGEETALAVGDVVKVSGAISESYGEKRINAKSVEIVGHEQGITADAVAALPLTGDKVGKLLTISGQIVEKKPSRLILADASGEQIVYLKQGADIDTGVYTVGDELTVTGVLSRYNKELRLLPRGKEDIVNLTWQKKEALGTAAIETAVPVGQAKTKVTLALLFAFVGLFCVNGYWCWRHREEILKSLKPWWVRVAGRSR